MRTWFLAGVVAVWLTMPSCTRHNIHIDPINIKIEPIEIKMEINIKIDRELDKILSWEDKYEGGKKGKESTGGEGGNR